MRLEGSPGAANLLDEDEEDRRRTMSTRTRLSLRQASYEAIKDTISGSMYVFVSRFFFQIKNDLSVGSEIPPREAQQPVSWE
jgi:hypothetical protein